MQKRCDLWGYALGLGLLGSGLITPLASAQNFKIIPAPNGTGTIVEVDGRQYNISGGLLSGDGRNLFHLFQDFGLNKDQIANFLANPQLRNILAGVNSGNPSVINGLLQVTGGNPNLYLLNPAGIIFGANAQLNVPAAFAASTATGVQFGGGWFSLNGSNNYQNLSGNPIGFAFTGNQAGSIINEGNLRVGPNQSLLLLGGSVINTGHLVAPGGEITVAAVPGKSLVRISQAGQLLSLDIRPPQPGDSLPHDWQLPILSLPELLTGPGAGHVNQVTVNPDGSIRLGSKNIWATPGLVAMTGSLNTSSNLNSTQVGGSMTVVGSRIDLIGATLKANGPFGGGTIRIGGDYLGGETLPQANFLSVDANSFITANALNTGNGGRVILWSQEQTQFNGQISARGGRWGGDGGFVETSSKNFLSIQGGRVNAGASRGNAGTWLLDPIAIRIVSGCDPCGSKEVEVTSINSALDSGTNVTLNTTFSGPEGGDILQNSDALIRYSGTGGSVVLEMIASGNITLNAGIEATSSPLHVLLEAGTSAGGEGVVPNAAVSLIGPIITQGGNLNVTAPGLIKAGDINTSSGLGDGGDIVLTSTTGGIRWVGTVDTSSSIGNAGNITATAGNGQGILVGGNFTANATTGTAGHILFNGNPIGLVGGLSVSSTSGMGSGGTVTFAGGVTRSSGSGDLNVRASNINFLGDIGSTGRIGSLQVNADTYTTFHGTVNAFSLIADGTGRTELRGGVKTVGSQDYRTPITINTAGTSLTDPLVLESTRSDSSITFASTLDTLDSFVAFVSPITNFNGGVDSVIGTGGITLFSRGVLTVGTQTMDAFADGFQLLGLSSETRVSLSGDIRVSDPLRIFAPQINTQGFNITGTDNASLLLQGPGGVRANNLTTTNGSILVSTSSNPLDPTANLLPSLISVGAVNSGSQSLALLTAGTLTTGALDTSATLTLQAPNGITLGGAVGSSLAPSSLIAIGPTTIRDSVTTSGNQIYNGTVTINSENPTTPQNALKLCSISGILSFCSSLAAGSHYLELISNGFFFNGGFGSVIGTKGITVASHSSLSVNQSLVDVFAPGLEYLAFASFAPDSALVSLGSDLVVSNSLRLFGPGISTYDSAGNAHSITALGNASITIQGFENQLFVTGLTTQGGDITVTTSSDRFNPNANLSFLTINTTTGPNVAAITSNGGAITLLTQGNIDTGNLNSGGFSRSGNITLSGANISTISGSIASPFGGGEINIFALDDITLGAFTPGNSALASGMINVNSTNGNIFLNGITNIGNSNLNLNAQGSITTNMIDTAGTVTLQAGTVNLAGAIGNTTRPDSLSINAPTINVNAPISVNDSVTFQSGLTTLGSNILSGGNQTYTGDVTFSVREVTLESTGGSLTFNNAINLTPVIFDLNLIADNFIFNGGSGSISSIFDVETVSLQANGSFTVNQDLMAAFGNGLALVKLSSPSQILLSSDISLGQALSLSAPNINTQGFGITGTRGGNINLIASNRLLAGRLDTLGAINLQGLESGVILNGSIGSLLAPSSLTVTGPTTITSNITTSGNSQIYNDSVTLANPVTLAATAGNITFNSTLDGATHLSLNAKTINFNGTVGSINPLTSLTVTGNSNVGAPITTSGNQLFNNPVTITGNDVAFISTGGDLNFNSVRSGGLGINLQAFGNIIADALNASNNAGNGGSVNLTGNVIQVGSINAQGTQAGGKVNINANSRFQATGTFIDQDGVNASISAAGGTSNGNIKIQINSAAPFVVGGSSENGTAGAITTGANNTIADETFSASTTIGNFELVTLGTAPPTPPDTPLTPEEEGEVNTILLGQENLQPSLALLSVPLSTLINRDGPISVALLEELQCQTFSDYFGRNLCKRPQTLEEIQAILAKIASQTGKKPGVIYVFSRPEQVELFLVTGTQDPIQRIIPRVTRTELTNLVEQFSNQVRDPRLIGTNAYLRNAQTLYQILIQPIQADLQAQNVDTLLFSLDSGLRTIPLAALHNGQRFLVEDYAVSLIPSMSLIDPTYRDIRQDRILAMGSETFSDLAPLPAVPVELATITQDLGGGIKFLNQDFTVRNLETQRRREDFAVVHLATHGEFNPGSVKDSFIAFSDRRVNLEQMRRLRLNLPATSLLTLSACRTAVGNEQAELGFAGLAVQSGIKTALASLWYVSDEGTLGLMTEFYQQLNQAPIKAEALRQAQIAMIRGNVKIENGQLISTSRPEPIQLPPGLANVPNRALNHPYYWSAFTMIGSPW